MSDGMKYVGRPVTELLGEAFERGKQYPLAYLVVLGDAKAKQEVAVVIGTDYFRLPRPDEKHLVGIPAEIVIGVGACPVGAWKNALAVAGGRCEAADSVRQRVQQAAPATALSQYRQENIDAEAKKNTREVVPPTGGDLPGRSIPTLDTLLRQYAPNEDK